MQEGKRLSRRGFLETAGATAGALMTTGTFAHLAIGADKAPDEKLNVIPGSPSNRGGLDDVRWASRVNPALIHRLYEMDTRGIVDDELIDEVGRALDARCRSILLATEAHERGRVRCPRCAHLIVRPDGVQIQNIVITCGSCAWSVRGCDYLKTYQGKHLNGVGAVALFEAFIGQFGRARLPREKMLAIDRLIHGFHCVSMGDPGRIAATNLIYAKNKRELLTFLDALPCGAGSTPGLRENKDQWERMLEPTDQPAKSRLLASRRASARAVDSMRLSFRVPSRSQQCP